MVGVGLLLRNVGAELNVRPGLLKHYDVIMVQYCHVCQHAQFCAIESAFPLPLSVPAYFCATCSMFYAVSRSIVVAINAPLLKLSRHDEILHVPLVCNLQSLPFMWSVKLRYAGLAVALLQCSLVVDKVRFHSASPARISHQACYMLWSMSCKFCRLVYSC